MRNVVTVTYRFDEIKRDFAMNQDVITSISLARNKNSVRDYIAKLKSKKETKKLRMKLHYTPACLFNCVIYTDSSVV